MKRWFIPAAARARGQSNDLNREILDSNLFNCHKEVINAPPVPSISRCNHIIYRHKNVWEYQWSNFIYNCMSTFLHYVRCKDALLDCSAPGGERCESPTWVDEIVPADTLSPKGAMPSASAMLTDYSRGRVLQWCHMHIMASQITGKLDYCSNPMFRLKTSKLILLALCEVTGGFPSQRDDNNVGNSFMYCVILLNEKILCWAFNDIDYVVLADHIT